MCVCVIITIQQVVIFECKDSSLFVVFIDWMSVIIILVAALSNIHFLFAPLLAKCMA